ncbi:SPASM domain-containing protein, partial [Candidatus Sumerlaeota bacterium]|nr:SPASM domain-containing protein [Candidatus Sumerlaeota bacterium]
MFDAFYLKDLIRKLLVPKTYFCDHLWSSVSIRVSGEVEACSCAPCPKPVFDFFSEPIQDIWNNSWFRNTRRYLLDGTKGERVFECCRSCPVSLQDRYYLPSLRLRLTEPRLIHSRRLKPVPLSLLEDKHSNYRRLLKILRARTDYIPAFPVCANIDPSNVCNLKCPFCPVGSGELDHAPRGFMPLERFERIMERLGPYLIHLDLYRYGEPLLNPDIVKMIEWASQTYRIYTSISANFSLPLSDDTLEGFIHAGLNQ